MRILIAAVVSEGILVFLAVLMQLIFNVRVHWNPGLQELGLGLTLVLPPLIGNHFLWKYAERATSSVFNRFSREIILPLCRQITWPIAVVVAILSGICEEWFFRGALNSVMLNALGKVPSCMITSVLFALVHFIGSFKRYGGMVPLYTVMGIYLWYVHNRTDSLAAVALLHGVYNFTVIMLVRRSCYANAASETGNS
jgi:membrane protease YdiL (CAAX protease family)